MAFCASSIPQPVRHQRHPGPFSAPNPVYVAAPFAEMRGCK